MGQAYFKLGLVAALSLVTSLAHAAVSEICADALSRPSFQISAIQFHQNPSLQVIDEITEQSLRELLDSLNFVQRPIFRRQVEHLRLTSFGKSSDKLGDCGFLRIRLRKGLQNTPGSRSILVHEAAHLAFALGLKKLPSFFRQNVKKDEAHSFGYEYRWLRRISAAIKEGRIDLQAFGQMLTTPEEKRQFAVFQSDLRYSELLSEEDYVNIFLVRHYGF